MRTGGNASSALRKGAWTAEEDMLLKNCIEKFGEGKWHLVPFKAGLNRCRKSCRLRWLNYLRPNIKRGDFSEDEVDLMLRLHKLLGNRWSLIAGRIPGRTANDVKNYWNTHLRSRSKQQKEEHKDNDSVTVIKPKPWAFSKILTHQNPQTAADNDNGNHVINLTGSLDDGVNHAINISPGLVSNPGEPDDKINKYLKEIDDDVEWPFGGFSMGREELYVVEQGDDIDSLFDLSKDDIMWDLLDLE